MATLFAILGALAGYGHALLLGRAVSGRLRGGGTALRLLLVGAFLGTAAVSNALLPGTAGWAVGLAAGVTYGVIGRS